MAAAGWELWHLPEFQPPMPDRGQRRVAAVYGGEDPRIGGGKPLIHGDAVTHRQTGTVRKGRFGLISLKNSSLIEV